MKPRPSTLLDAACIWGTVLACLLVALILAGIPQGLRC